MRIRYRVNGVQDPVYTVPDSLGHDIEFGYFAVIFTLTTFFYDYLLLNPAILSKCKSHTCRATIQFDIVTMWIRYSVKRGLKLVHAQPAGGVIREHK